jgi:hypothetical protein
MAQTLSAFDFGFRITVSNFTSFLGPAALDQLLLASDLSNIQFQYSHSLALTMVVNALFAHSVPIDPATLSDPATNFSALSAIPMPPTLEAAIAKHIGGITTVAGLYKFIALGTDARLGALMEVWHEISQYQAIKELGVPGPVVSTATPIITPYGTLALAQPF